MAPAAALAVLLACAPAFAGEDKVLPPAEARRQIARIRAISEKVFAASPEARARLAHLIVIAEQGLAKEGWLQVVEGPRSNARGADGVNLSAVLRERPDLELGGTFWHETQHVYDRQRLKALEKISGVMTWGVIFPIEAEQRGYEAGCAFWRAGLAAGFGQRESGICDGFPMEFYSCGHDWAAEQTLRLFAEQQKQGRGAAEMERLLDELPAGGFAATGDTFEDFKRERTFGAPVELRAHCFETERSLSGNALSFARPAWSLSRCLAEAAAAVLAPAWRSARELCGLDDDYRRKQPDVRAIARTLSR